MKDKNIHIQKNKDFQGEKNRIIGFLSIFVGLLSIIVILLLDLIRGFAMDIGFGQIVSIFPGLLLIVIGLVYLTTKTSESAFKRITKFFTNQLTINISLVFLFALYSILFFLGRWQGLTPSPDLGNDAATIASFSAAYDHPENFTGDVLLKNPKDAAPYKLFLLPLLSMLTRITGDYSLSLLLLLPLSMFLQLWGFYLLGKKIFNKPIYGLFLTIICALNIQYGAGDYWGFFVDPQPRFLFQAVFPYVLLLYFNYYEKPKFWPLLILVAGLIGHLHLLSSPVLPFIFWMSFFFINPPGMKTSKKIVCQIFNIIVYLVSMLPVVPIYFQNSGNSDINIISTTTRAEDFIAYNETIMNRVTSVATSYFHSLNVHFILIPFLISILLVIFLNKKRLQNLKIVSIWLAGIIFISIISPILLDLFEWMFTLVPISLRLARELRYTYPLFYMVILFGIEGILEISKQKVQRLVPVIIGMITICSVIWINNSVNTFRKSPYYFEDMAVKEISCLKSEKLFCPIKIRVNEQEALIYLNENTQITDKILAIPTFNLAPQIRYGSLRTSSLSITDASRMPFSNSDISTITALYTEYKEIPNPDDIVEFDNFIDFACKIDTNYLLSDWTIPVEVIQNNTRVNLELSNDYYTVAKIIDCIE